MTFEENSLKTAPLAERMRPKNLAEFTGQEHILAPGKLLYRMIEADRITSIILYGPPGTGKTTIARLIASATGRAYRDLNAVMSGVKDVKEVIDEARKNVSLAQPATILFIDEIHRFNKSQQDVLLSAVEAGIITLVGATTENPFYEVNPALISRSTVFELKTLSTKNIETIIDRAVKDEERGLGRSQIVLTGQAAEILAEAANGDARVALNALDLAFLTTRPGKDARIVIDEAVITDCIQKKVVKYDKNDDNHYDTISAFIKSMRGSDPDAALYWLAKMLYAGEDPKFIARRMLIFSSEDIGNANPDALVVAASVFKAAEVIGMPECQLNLAHGAAYLASSPKSNSVTSAIYAAMSDIKNGVTAPIPGHLKNEPTVAKEGSQYLYPHDYPGHIVKQSYLPGAFENNRYYHPTNIGYEKKIGEYLAFVRQITGQKGDEDNTLK